MVDDALGQLFRSFMAGRIIILETDERRVLEALDIFENRPADGLLVNGKIKIYCVMSCGVA